MSLVSGSLGGRRILRVTNSRRKMFKIRRNVGNKSRTEGTLSPFLWAGFVFFETTKLIRSYNRARERRKMKRFWYGNSKIYCAMTLSKRAIGS